MLRTTCIGRNEREVDFCRCDSRKLDLRPLGFHAESLVSRCIIAEIDKVFFLEFLCEEINDDEVKVVTTKVSVTVGALYFEHSLAESENRNVESSTTEVIDCDGAFAFFIETVSK